MLARLFTICRPTLLSIAWFARFHGRILRTRDRLYARLAAMPAWQAAHRTVAAVKVRIAALGSGRAGLLRRLLAARTAIRAGYRYAGRR